MESLRVLSIGVILLIIALASGVLAADPQVDSISLNATSWLNLTTDNLTAYWTVSDGDSDPVKNITNWYVDGVSWSVLNMPFEADGDQNATDYSGYGNHGTVYGNTTWNSTGTHDDFGSYDFDGDSDYVLVTNDDSLNFGEGAFTVALWARSDQVDGALKIFLAKGIAGGPTYHEWLWQQHVANKWRFVLSNGTDLAVVDSDDIITEGRWYHLVAVRETDGAVKIYVDGDLQADSASLTGNVSNTRNFVVGGRSNLVDYWFNGSLDDVVLFDRALSAEQISEIYNDHSDIIVSQETAGDDDWKICLTPNDGNGDGTESCSSNLTVQSGPDLLITASGISLSNEDPNENETVDIIANITNQGDQSASTVKVRFLVNDVELGNETLDIPAGSWNTTSRSWNVPMGLSNITLVIDPDDSISEIFETNNNASRTGGADAYHTFYGHTTGFTVLGSDTDTLLELESDIKNILVTDVESDIDFSSLIAVGRKKDSSASSSDFTEIDTALNMTGFSDSISAVWSTDGTSPKNTQDITIYSTTVTDVPIANSTDNANFVTGILWDSSDDSDGEYDSIEKEDLVFITPNNDNQVGKFGTYDYELKVPALLRNYKGKGTDVTFYLELE